MVLKGHCDMTSGSIQIIQLLRHQGLFMVRFTSGTLTPQSLINLYVKNRPVFHLVAGVVLTSRAMKDYTGIRAGLFNKKEAKKTCLEQDSVFEQTNICFLQITLPV